MNNMLTDLEEYFKNTSREKVLQDWKEAKRKSIKTIEDLIALTPEDFVSDIGYIIAPDTPVIERVVKRLYPNDKNLQEACAKGIEWQSSRKYNGIQIQDILRKVIKGATYEEVVKLVTADEETRKANFKSWIEQYLKE